MGTEIIQNLVGQRCWYVSAGGVTVPTFQLVCGSKVKRSLPLNNLLQSEEFRMYQGSHSLLVWCSWRLQKETAVLATSDDAAGIGTLENLVGALVEEAVCSPPAWDLELKFSDGHTLLVFCDNYGAEPTASQNWELWVPGAYAQAGLGGEWCEEPDEGV